MKLRASELRTLRAVADALLPALEGPGPLWHSSASDLRVPERFAELFPHLPDRKLAGDLRLLLRVLGTPAAALIHGYPRPFHRLEPANAERALRRMAVSRVPKIRTGFQGLRRLAGYLFVVGEESERVWPDLGYPGPLGSPPQVARDLSPVPVPEPAGWEADVVIVGSGAGGGVAAAVLAGAGLDVVVLEKGKYLDRADFTHREAEGHRDLYLDGTLGATDDLGVALLAGSCLGGGTTINYSTSLATPPSVREEWDRVSGLRRVFTGSDFEQATKAVLDRMHVTTEESSPSRRDRILEMGASAAGWSVGPLPRNVDGCPQDDECGYCLLGCRRGAKQSGLRTWLRDAERAAARLVVEADVAKIVVERGRAAGVLARVRGVPLRVRARTVVVACGALSTPALLQRTGLGGPAVGRGLRLHPVSAVWGRFDEPVRPWAGTMQARVSGEFADLDGDGYGYRFETAPIHPAIPGALQSWGGGPWHKDRLARLSHLSPIGVLLRDRDGGRATLRRDGRPRWRYRLSARDREHMRHGLHRAAEALAAAGAEELIASSTLPVTWRADSGEPLRRFRERLDAAGYGPNRTVYVSFHQMGTAAMGADPATSVVGPGNEAHDTPGLFVMDASCFPTASGVNPMVSIMAVAHRGASALADRLSP